ncbi:MAG: HEPN domain-containing protein [Actinobacteria bacterium]|nr:HEPN domain-containing protein [Actinomycetota bacterium]
MQWKPGRSTIEYLLSAPRLERLTPVGIDRSADDLFERAERRLATAQAGADLGDFEGAFVAGYDAYRMAAESLLLRQAMRAAGGDGSHVAVEDAVAAQFADEIPAFAKPTFDRFRRSRHAAQYFDPGAPDLTSDDATWALVTAASAIDVTRRVSRESPPPVFDP